MIGGLDVMVVVSQGWNVGGVFGVGPSIGVAWLLALVEVGSGVDEGFFWIDSVVWRSVVGVACCCSTFAVSCR